METLIRVGGGEPARREYHLDQLVPAEATELARENAQRAIPAIAHSGQLMAQIEAAVHSLPTDHRLILGDSRKLDTLPDESVHLIVTSPPYWNLKEYRPDDGQLGVINDYDEFLTELDHVWKHCYRLLVPGGRLVVDVGDICLPRRRYGRHVVFPLHASIQERCRGIGFDNLSPIIWYKIANAQLEAGGGRFLGKPYEPNAVIKNDIEYVLFQRKPGGYRNPTRSERILSTIPAERHHEWFQQIWTMTGASTRYHPAPYPLPFAERLVRMFSFVGDTVLDPFSGTGTTSAAAMRWGRDSIGIEVHQPYHASAVSRLQDGVPRQLPF